MKPSMNFAASYLPQKIKQLADIMQRKTKTRGAVRGLYIHSMLLTHFYEMEQSLHKACLGEHITHTGRAYHTYSDIGYGEHVKWGVPSSNTRPAAASNPS